MKLAENEYAFSSLGLPSTPTEARDDGPLTMMIDWGLPLAAQRDVLMSGSEAIDIAKLAVGLCAVMPSARVRGKVDVYRDAGIEPFPGGMLAEYAHSIDRARDFFSICVGLGFRLVEVSDNVVRMSFGEKRQLICAAIEDYGLNVIGEVGSKSEKTSIPVLIDDIHTCLDAGAWKVFVEAAELAGDEGALRDDICKAILGETDLGRIIFELPGPWIPGISAHHTKKLMSDLIDMFGTEVNIGNVLPDDIWYVEMRRQGVGIPMTFASS